MEIVKRDIQYAICFIELFKCQIAQENSANNKERVNTRKAICEPPEAKASNQLNEHLRQKMPLFLPHC